MRHNLAHCDVFDTQFKAGALKATAMASEVAEESISAVRAVKAFNMDEKLVSLLTPPNLKIEYWGRKTARYTALLVSGMFLCVR